MDDYEDEIDDAGPIVEAPVTERVRIIGAESALVAAGIADTRDSDTTSDPVEVITEIIVELEIAQDELVDENPSDEGSQLPAAQTELPHWTEPPTGQAPVVLRVGDDIDDKEAEAWSALRDAGPAWREHRHEWDEMSFEPSQLADDETRVGVLDQAPIEERRPWEFQDQSEVSDREDADGEPLDPVGDVDSDLPAEQELIAEGEARDRRGESTGQAPDPADDGPDESGDFVTQDTGSLPPSTFSRLLRTRPDRGAKSAQDSPEAKRGRRSSPAPAQAQDTPSGVAAAHRSPSRSSSKRATGRNLPIAIGSGVVLAIIALGAFKLGTLESLILSILVITLAAAECFAALRRAGRRPAALLGLVGTVALMVAVYAKGVGSIPLVLALMVMSTMVWYVVETDHHESATGVSATLLGFCWVGLLGSYSALLLSPSQFPHRHGIAFLLGAIIATVGHDVGGITVGTLMGKHRLPGSISPNKTWEGLAGGMVGAVVLSVLLTSQIAPWTTTRALVLGIVVAVFAPLGDLCESLVKRDIGVKDMGSLLPGHGGVLDRVDALLFVLPATYYLVRVLNLG